MEIRSLVVACLCSSAIVVAEQPSAPLKAYEVEDAYKIYSLLIPGEESYGFAKGTLIIQEGTVPNQDVPESCIDPEAASLFKDAIADYRRVNSEQRLLQRRFEIEKPYEIVSSDTIGVSSPNGWKGFYKRYPGSGGFMIMSAVGFNKAKTRAIVYTGSSCGGLCGLWRFHLLEKKDSKWTVVPGIRCAIMS
jgi:hypothetical protein